MQSFSHALEETTKSVLLPTDRKSLTQSTQSKSIPSSLSTNVDAVQKFNFILGLIPGKAKASGENSADAYNFTRENCASVQFKSPQSRKCSSEIGVIYSIFEHICKKIYFRFFI